MQDLRYRDSELVDELDAAPITAEDELGVLGELTTGRPEPSSHRRPNRHLLTRMMGRLGHVPEHEAPRPAAAWLGRAAALLVGVFLLGTAFIASYVGVLHQTKPHAVPIGVVNGDVGAQALLSSLGTSPFTTIVYPDSTGADNALASRAVYAVLDTDPVNDGLRLTLAGGFAKLAKLAQGHLDLHSSRSRADPAMLAGLLADIGAEPAAVAAGLAG